jgi:serine protease Do
MLCVLDFFLCVWVGYLKVFICLKYEDVMKVELVGAAPFGDMQNSVEQAVVQVFAQVVAFDWLEPYSTREQYETRASGFFIDTQGFIITNAHVVNQAQSVWVQLPAFGQKAFFVDVVGFCPEYDFALLALKPEDVTYINSVIGGIPFLPLGDSDILRRTDSVLVLGYPLGQSRVKSSTGVVSGWETFGGRSWIQITAPINPGNSGGPLVNAYGQVIGVAVSAAVPSQNIGYASPVNELKLILESLTTPGLVRRPSLGVAFNFGSDALAHVLGNPVPSGLYIGKVLARSLADAAGILAGDMLYRFNGLDVDAFGDISSPWTPGKASLYDLLSRLPVGAPLDMVIYRKGKRHEISCAFDLVDPYPVRTMYPNYEKIDYEVIAGMVIMQLTDDHIQLLVEQAPHLSEYKKLENRIEPILVISHILPGSLAQLARSLIPGDIISELHGEKITTLDLLRSALKKSRETGFIQLKTSNQIAVAFDFTQVAQEELRLSEYFGYHISDSIREIL